MSRTSPAASKPKDPAAPPADDELAAAAGSDRREDEALPAAEPRPETVDAEPESEPGPESALTVEPADPDALKRELEAARRDAEEQRDALLRARAEMDNLRKRSAREIESAHKYGIERLVAELLPVKDSLELGLGAARLDGAELASLRDGTALTLKMLETALEKFDVTEIDPVDAAFDPEFHQAMSIQEEEGVESGTVLKVVQKGYLLSGRLVRPAMVIVAK